MQALLFRHMTSNICMQLIPRTLWLDPSGKQLMQWPIEELETLRGSKVQFSKKQKLSEGHLVEVKGITAAQVSGVSFIDGRVGSVHTCAMNFKQIIL